ncbi:MBL fold metallo-hydrolase [Mesorhizobium australicum]|uniref:Glyoxylase, beta-lactamase superfamily II n=1 Tax=Mesorhizobium australicum TaxID=536018 RepID=A0A1X7N0Y1_9HYPH|nr:MBL fold metallo-hydrolase [Mesorhizobium australicum]SMH30931.1 Glyoxylase, beta-lactamase superfamily II [Mesorhizobium australicum]
MLAKRGKLEFPWADTPPPGEAREVAPGLFWARLPLPFRLNHVNVWLLEEDDGWTVIDTGCATPEIIAAWEALLAGPMRGRPVRRVVATHGHVDHIGLSGWMVSRFDADYVGTFAEWMWARVSHMHDVPGSNDAHHYYLVRNGFDDAVAQKLVKSRHRFINLSSPIPGWITEIRDGETVRLGGRSWRVIVTRGHAFEHASFLDEEANILIAGDHLLPKITPVIAVYEMMPKADPLGDYLESFPSFSDVRPDALVLPSHDTPYYGISERILELREHHDKRLAATVEFLRTPRVPLDLSKSMFPHIEGPDNMGFALGETLAHVNHLVRLGAVADVSAGSGTALYQALR